MTAKTARRMPAIFLPHGGGPWPWMDSMRQPYAKLTRYLKGIPDHLPRTPEALLVVSAHWEEPAPTVMTSPTPPMFHDYSGFPESTYQVVWPAPGAQDLAGEIEHLLAGQGLATGRDPDRGFDHGTFVPLALAYPDAGLPTLQLSLKAGLDPVEHLRIGRALAPLRDRGVFMIGSGMSYHNMRAFMTHARGGPAPIEDSKVFDQWLAEAMSQPADHRESQLAQWEQAPAARACHPREEHLLPLHVIAGACGDDEASLPYQDVILGAHVSAVQFG